MAALLKKILAHSRQSERLLSALRRQCLPHALVFSGPAGVGKRMAALGLAQAILCRESESPCGWCVDCRKAAEGQHENLLVVEPAQRQIKIESIRQVTDFLSLKAWGADRPRVVVIDSAHLLNPQAANALLKSLEEPPEGTTFILVTAQVQALLPTIRSRCQTVYFGALTVPHLKQLRPEAADWTLSAAQGRLDLVDQLNGEEYRPIREEVFKCWGQLLDREQVALSGTWRDKLADRDQALIWSHFHQQVVRDALVKKTGATSLLHQDQTRMLERLSEFPKETLFELWQGAKTLEADLQANVDRFLATESYLLHAAEVLR